MAALQLLRTTLLEPKNRHWLVSVVFLLLLTGHMLSPGSLILVTTLHALLVDDLETYEPNSHFTKPI